MAPEAIGEAFKNRWTFAGTRPFDGPFCSGSNGEHVHAIHLFSSHAEGSRFAPDLRIAGGTVMGHADRPFVVLHHKQDGQFPKLGHVQAFKELPVVAGSVSEEGCGDGVTAGIPHGITLVAAGEGSAEGHRDSFADKGEPPQHVMGL